MLDGEKLNRSYTGSLKHDGVDLLTSLVYICTVALGQ